MTYYILIEKNRSTGIKRVVNVYDNHKMAKEEMERLMEIWKEDRAYKIDESIAD